MGTKTALGEFEHHVLLAVIRLDGNGYTSSVVAELEERTGRAVSLAAVYIAMRRLERAGLVRTALRRDTELGESRERRYVRTTPLGIKLARVARERFVRLWQGLAVLAVKE